ncbi:acyl carrier protein [Streptomyces spinoverrucosus]|uniref:acyl carrier protein n=1 Tax=Streptomyces spinoverrucosus TaxID=284043 RepID=UPI0027DA0CC6|nr:acyl carrier protein [Streptomyces spinoverrucosus]
MPNTLAAITAALTETFPIDASMITPDRSFEDLGLDSLALVEMGLILQERTGVTLDEGDLPKTVGELVVLLEAAQADGSTTVTA